MNYFERLVRRALLRPASAPGAALDDPFATVAEWPLEAPAAAPAPHAVAPVVSSPSIALASGKRDPGKTRAPVATPETLHAVDAPAPPVTMPGESSPLAHAAPEVLAPTHVDSPVPPAQAVGPHREALELADAFMRSLGVQSQLPEIAPAAAPQPVAAQTRVAERQDEGQAADPARAQVVPPLPAAPALSAPAAKRVAAGEESPQVLAAQERSREPAPRTRTVVETRHVVVERKAKPRDEAGVSGGGAPRFGLGQL